MPAHYVHGYPNVIFVGEDAGVIPPAKPRGLDDYPSILLVHADAASLPKADLDALDDFGRAVTESYDERLGGPRALANFAELGPMGGERWFARKFTWTQALRTFPSLDEAISYLSGRYEIDPEPCAPGLR